MPGNLVLIIVFAVLFLHGVAHGGAIAAMFWVEARPEMDSGGWQTAKSWIVPSLSQGTTKIVAILFWGASMLGFVAASLSFVDFVIPETVWRDVAVISAAISTTGILIFLGRWPAFNTLAALAVNLAVFITQFWMHWPPR